MYKIWDKILFENKLAISSKLWHVITRKAYSRSFILPSPVIYALPLLMNSLDNEISSRKCIATRFPSKTPKKKCVGTT